MYPEGPPHLSQAYPHSQPYAPPPPPQHSYGYPPSGLPPYYQHQPCNSYPQHSAPPVRTQAPSFKSIAHEYNQHVKVHITANVWVVGVIIAVLDAANKVQTRCALLQLFGTACEYRVEYKSPTTGHVVQRDVPTAELRPYDC
ncbi:hypothetical protein K488DRAFT_69034 [Vararia minispora EC-137]|uniref:Uncharacterized protein n=1 Tax=Vararia minispora EC-137 TaxID=1314806 RepID=A0ACB8QSF1_9AGAM|nr:hypothetical protein K488DRAFT_69034 [Vararia minispora EC-137]